jgi:asparagine synthetase B (glutamine-hydrolysing)
MCGVAAFLTNNNRSARHHAPDALNFASLRDRGPDAFGSVSRGSWTLCCAALRMQNSAAQPSQNESLVLCFNGEIYQPAAEHRASFSDTDRLVEVMSLPLSFEAKAEIIDASLEMEGAFVVLDVKSDTLFFGRDLLGRRSLVMQHTDAGLCVASAALNGGAWTDVPVDTLFVAGLDCAAGRMCVTPVARPGMRWLTDRRMRPLREAVDLRHALSMAVAKRVHPSTLGLDGEVGILFSGGVDCVALAALAHEHVPGQAPIHLINVAFARDARDRVNAEDALGELASVYPSRAWRLIRVDVCLEQVLESQSRIQELCAGSSTNMDFNLGCVVFFASKRAPPSCRALLTGTGADELLGGYRRHQTALERLGEDGWARELALDLERLWRRNLGRDDRCAGANGRELRFPFLDLQVVAACGLGSVELGNKLALRRVVAQLGLGRAAARHKVAMQFGSKIAKLNKGNGTLPFQGVVR